MEAAGIEPAARLNQTPKQVALLPANALISHRIVPPLPSHLVPSRPVQFPAEGAHWGTCSPVLQSQVMKPGDWPPHAAPTQWAAKRRNLCTGLWRQPARLPLLNTV